MRQTVVTALMSATAVLLASCAGLGGGVERGMTREAKPEEIIGEWHMSEKTLALLKRDGYREGAGEKYTIVFDKDGTMKFASVLEPDHFGIEHGKYREFNGTWALTHDDHSFGDGYAANEVLLRSEGSRTRCDRPFLLVEVKGQLRLWQFYGDPDSSEFIEYERR